MDFQNTQGHFFSLDLPNCSSSTPSPTYDVFLSFRGADTRRNFTDHLYNALIRAGIHTFRDDDELPRGNDISSELLKAIKESRFSIVVFSKNYASSRWCLEELVNILDCKKTNGQLFIPVFYHVKPSEIRKQKGSFKDAFASHEKHEDHEKVNKWRAALREAADLAGWSVDGSRNETEDIDQIVEKIFPYVNRELVVCKHPVGLQSRVEHLKSLLKVGSDGVCVVGFYGMGGIGKTTLARAFFNAFIRLFESGCFVTNVREESRHSGGLVLLQKQLLYDLNGNDYNILDVHRGINLIKKILGRKRVLIVLDDLDHVRQFASLMGSRSSFRKESLIIITTRDKHLLDQTQTDVKYEVKGLNHLESLELFSRHAFNCLTPSKIYERILKSIVWYTRGHPLALEVIGSSLVYKHIEYWEKMCERLKVIPNGEVQKILRISFDALDDSILQDMFLDIACFYGFHIKACYSYGSCGISNLKDRCLLQEGYPFEMHDLLQQMGRQIVQEKFPKEPGKHTRLWDPELVCDVLEDDKGTELVEGIKLKLPKQMQFSTKSFAKMPNLRFLRMKKVYLDGSFLGLFKELRWLCWDMCPLEHLFDFYPRKLVYLKMWRSNLHTLWTTTKSLNDLRVLAFSDSKSLVTTPDFTGMPNLEELLLYGCKSLSNIHTSFGVLNKLRVLDLSHCKSLVTAPDFTGMPNLEKLLLRGCESLSNIHTCIGVLNNLRVLDLSHSESLVTTPDFTGMPNLEKLLLGSCANLSNIHTSIGVLNNLRLLDLQHCKSLVTTPDFTGMPNLKILFLRGCESWTNIHTSIGVLNNLRVLDLCLSKSLVTTPDFTGMPNLEELSLGGCESLSNIHTSIGVLNNLRVLDLSHSKSLVTTPDFTGMPNLEELLLEGCESLSNIHTSIGVLSKLTKLSLWNCKNLKTLPGSICRLRLPEVIFVAGCSNLEELPEQFGNIKSLSSLDASGTRIKRLPQSIELLKSLRFLLLTGCSSLEGLPDQLGNLECLKFLSVCGTAICHLPQSIELLPNLRRLELEGCKQLKSLPRWNNGFRKLEYLDLSDCNLSDGDITDDIGELSSLLTLFLSRNNFSCLPAAVGKLTNLQVFHADGCSSLLKLPYLSNLRHLMRLDLYNCSKLVEIQGLENLKSISKINLQGCTSLSSSFFNHLLQEHPRIPYGCLIGFPEQYIPNLFEYQLEEGSSISFDVPLDVQHHLSHLNLCFSRLSVNEVKFNNHESYIHVYNKTRGNELKGSVNWTNYIDNSAWIQRTPDYEMKGGDRIEVSFQTIGGGYPKLKCGVHLVCIKKGIHGGSSDLSRHPLKRGRDLNPGEASRSKSKLS